MSQDRSFFERMRKTLVIYRMAIGQPRQEDLVNALLSRMPEDQLRDLMERPRIDLSPPAPLQEEA